MKPNNLKDILAIQLMNKFESLSPKLQNQLDSNLLVDLSYKLNQIIFVFIGLNLHNKLYQDLSNRRNP